MSIFESLTSLFAPNNCLGCGREGSLLCDHCYAALPPLPGSCFGCHRTLSIGAGCPACRHTAGLSGLRVVSGYGGLATALVAQLKFHGNQSAAKQMASIMLTDFRLPPTALLAYIPATTQHVRQRGYDQAELLARQLARLCGQRQITALARQGHSHQLGAGREQRLRQLTQVMRIKNPGSIVGQHIILVDDVLTTGATLSTAAQLLLEVGARRVDGLVFAQA